MKACEVPIDKIVIGDRFRTDAGDVSDLCHSIERLGLLQPIAINRGQKLIGGLRRIAAFRQLGRKTIPATIAETLDDAGDLLLAERDENQCRVPFTPLELAAAGRALKEFEVEAAKERRASGKSLDGSAGGRGRKKPSGTVPEGIKGQARDKIGRALGVSGRTVEMANAVAAAAEADPETFGPIAEEMDRTGKIKPAYVKMRKIKKMQEIEAGKHTEPDEKVNGDGPKSVAVRWANEAVNCLMKIPKNDHLRKHGFQVVMNYLKHNK